jgi:hypothetical protein
MWAKSRAFLRNQGTKKGVERQGKGLNKIATFVPELVNTLSTV